MSEILHSGSSKPPFEARLLNGQDGDPGLFVSLGADQGGRAILLDCGDCAAMAPGDLMKVTDLFLTHCHLDHFAGFDRLFRGFLGLTRTLRVWGGEGTIDRVHRRVLSYEWNRDPREEMTIAIRELDGDRIRAVSISTADGFVERHVVAGNEAGAAAGGLLPSGAVHGGAFLRTPVLEVRFARLPHTVPSLGLAVVAPAHTRVDADRLAASGLAAGPWISELVRRADADARGGTALSGTLDVAGSARDAAALARDLLHLEPAYKLVYVTDTRFEAGTRDAVVSLASGADLLYCEAVFIEADADKARATGHLTARQCGTLARESAVLELRTFHHSRRYPGAAPILAEVRAEFPGAE
jgi:ribonuclease Z